MTCGSRPPFGTIAQYRISTCPLLYRSFLGEAVMRWIVGGLLVLAAVLKAVELVTVPAAGLVNPLGPYFAPVQVGLELALGLFMWSRYYWRVLRWASLALFISFSGYSLYLALHGAASCGCFGPVHVSPWWMLGLDLAVIAGLLASILRERAAPPSAVIEDERQLPLALRRSRFGVAVIAGAAIVCTTLLVRQASQPTALAEGSLTQVGGLVILEPEQWVGQPLPIARSIDLDLSHGDWIVLLHRHDCPACQELVPQFEHRAAQGERIALLEVPPYGESDSPAPRHHGRLNEDHEWFVQTPVELRLKAGLVTAVTTHAH